MPDDDNCVVLPLSLIVAVIVEDDSEVAEVIPSLEVDPSAVLLLGDTMSVVAVDDTMVGTDDEGTTTALEEVVD
jgi:hypothetical protein